MNSTAAIKAFTGRHGGTVCTSSNAERALSGRSSRARRCCSSPTSTSAATPRCSTSACPSTTACVFNPHKPGGGLTDEQLRAAKVILWRGHCSVHGRFTLEAVVDEVRERVPGVNVLVHPECQHEVVSAADYVGSTEYIIRDPRRGRARLARGRSAPS